MQRTFTEDDLIRYVYGEMNEDQCVDIKAALDLDRSLQSQLNEIVDSKALLGDLMLEASDEVTSKILRASKDLQSA